MYIYKCRISVKPKIFIGLLPDEYSTKKILHATRCANVIPIEICNGPISALPHRSKRLYHRYPRWVVLAFVTAMNNNMIGVVKF
jgi:hypothetical protein